MAVNVEVTESVQRAVQALRGGNDADGDGIKVRQSDITDLAHRGLLRKSGSGAGNGWEIDGEVAAAMGMPEFDYS